MLFLTSDGKSDDDDDDDEDDSINITNTHYGLTQWQTLYTLRSHVVFHLISEQLYEKNTTYEPDI